MGQAYVPRITVDSRFIGSVYQSVYQPGVLAFLEVGGEIYPGGYRLDLPGGGYRNFYVATSPALAPGTGVFLNYVHIYLVCYSLSYTAALPYVEFTNMGVHLVGNS